VDWAKVVASYWRGVLWDALVHALPKKPRDIVADLVLVAITILVLKSWVEPGAASQVQIDEEVRWTISGIGALLFVAVAFFLVQLIATPLRAQEAAVREAVQKDQKRRVSARRRALERLLAEGNELLDRVKQLPVDAKNVPQIARAVRAWQGRAMSDPDLLSHGDPVQLQAEGNGLQREFSSDEEWPGTWRGEMSSLLGAWVQALNKRIDD
jgi:hypothetical protein